MSLIYWLENNPEHAPGIRKILERMEHRRDSLCTSVFALAETLVGPYRQNDKTKADEIRQFFCPANLTLLPFTESSAERYAGIRAENKVSPADAIHLSCAAEAGVDLFFTNDGRLQGLVIPGIKFITGIDRAPI